MVELLCYDFKPFLPELMQAMDQNFFKKFADEWIAAWNAHDLDRVLSHYSDDFEMTSPFIITIAGVPSGTLKGKQAVAAYWSKALALIPDLKFELMSVLSGVNSLTLYYKGANARCAAEVFYFNAEGWVIKAFAHYQIDPPEGTD